MLLLLIACASECDDPSRIDGAYTVFSSVNSYTAVEGDVEQMPAGAAFYNGSREWQLNYVPSSGQFTILIESQEFKAQFSPDDTNCNRFSLDAAPLWSGETEDPFGGDSVLSSHDVTWHADLIWSGEELGGSYTVTDNWLVQGGAAGVLDASGTVSGILVTGE